MRMLLSLLLFSFSFSALAKMNWSDFSLTYLNGSHYELGDNQRQVLTFEHASGHRWGDTFLFVDRLHSSDGKQTTYGEFSPRWFIQQYAGNGPLKDLSVASTIEMGDGFTHYLLGAGFSWRVPHFKFFKTNFYRRNNHVGNSNWQMTASWAVPFELGESQWHYGGFLDWFTSVDNKPSGYNFTSQLKLNIAPWLGLDSPLYLGTEYVFWNNKFGVSGVRERNANFLIKWHW